MTMSPIRGAALAVVLTMPAGALCHAPVWATDEPIITIAPAAPVDATVDPRARDSVMQSFKQMAALAEVPSGWTGNKAACSAGETTAAFKQATLDTVNWYRNMVGLPDATFSAEYNRLAQGAALMMTAAGMLSHSPGPDWPCYSQEGSTGAGSSNLALGASGPNAIQMYINDPGSNNVSVGHRWWVLRPGAQVFGTGDTEDSNALHVTANPWPGIEPAVTWPKPGYFPAEGLPTSGRWSFFPPRTSTYGQPGYWDLSDASVTVTGPSGAVPTLQTHARSDRLVWVMPSDIEVPSADTSYEVTIRGARDGLGASTGFTYTVVLVPGEVPDTRITGGPGSRTEYGEAVFDFEPVRGLVQCRLDGGDWEYCSPPMEYENLSSGQHMFEVRAGNKWGWDLTPATRGFSVVRLARVTALEVKARSVVRSSRLRLDVDPDLSAGNYRVTLQRRLRGMWADLRRVWTQGNQEVRVVNLPKGRYRVVVPAQRGMQSASSRPVRLAR